MSKARPAAGVAGGALGGLYPSPSHGSPSSSGYRLTDDFLRPPEGTLYGDMRWEAITMGSAPVVTQITPSTALEVGIARVATNASPSADEGGLLGWPVAGGRQWHTTPQVGVHYTAKLSIKNDTYVRAFSGLIQNQAPWWTGTNDCIGFRASAGAAAANWFGVVRVGGSENTVDLGVEANSTYRVMRWARVIDEDGNDGIQFYLGTQPTQAHNHCYPVLWTAVGSIVTTMPTANALTICPAAVATQNTSQRSVDIDYLDLGGPARRVA